MKPAGYFERRFRRRFTRSGGGYRYRHGDVDYGFDSDEVEQFVAEWRRYWGNPLLWIGYVLIGICLPLWIYSHDLVEFAVIVALLAALVTGAALEFPLRQPSEVAVGRSQVPVQRPERPPSGWMALIFSGLWIAFLTYWIYEFSHAPPPSHVISLFWLVMGGQLAAGMIWQWLAYKRTGSPARSRQARAMAGLAAPVFAALVVTGAIWMSATASIGDKWFAQGAIAVLAGSVLYPAWRQRREDEDALT